MVGWFLAALLAAVAVGFLVYGFGRIDADDRPAIATERGISGPRISHIPWAAIIRHIPWAAIIRADIRKIGTTWNVVVTVALENLHASIESPNPLVRAYQRLFTVTSSPDERQLPWIPGPVASSHLIVDFINAELAVRQNQGEWSATSAPPSVRAGDRRLLG